VFSTWYSLQPDLDVGFGACGLSGSGFSGLFALFILRHDQTNGEQIIADLITSLLQPMATRLVVVMPSTPMMLQFLRKGLQACRGCLVSVLCGQSPDGVSEQELDIRHYLPPTSPQSTATVLLLQNDAAVTMYPFDAQALQAAADTQNLVWSTADPLACAHAPSHSSANLVAVRAVMCADTQVGPLTMTRFRGWLYSPDWTHSDMFLFWTDPLMPSPPTEVIDTAMAACPSHFQAWLYEFFQQAMSFPRELFCLGIVPKCLAKPETMPLLQGKVVSKIIAQLQLTGLQRGYRQCKMWKKLKRDWNAQLTRACVPPSLRAFGLTLRKGYRAQASFQRPNGDLAEAEHQFLFQDHVALLPFPLADPDPGGHVDRDDDQVDT
jgi:hypothetical protein